MTTALLVGMLLVGGMLAWINQRRLRERERADYIRHFQLPPGVLKKVHERHPQLRGKDLQLVARGLSQFFLAYQRSGKRAVAMPSQVVDDLWHEFILHTRSYQAFCKRAFGSFLHHTPAAALGSQKSSNAGLRRVWWQCCKEENIRPDKPSRLPLLFALDAKLAIAGGFVYVTNCKLGVMRRDEAGVPYCAGDFSSSSVDGTTDGFGSSDGTSSSSSPSKSDGGSGSEAGSSNESSSSSCSGSSCGGSSCGGGGCSS